MTKFILTFSFAAMLMLPSILQARTKKTPSDTPEAIYLEYIQLLRAENYDKALTYLDKENRDLFLEGEKDNPGVFEFATSLIPLEKQTVLEKIESNGKVTLKVLGQATPKDAGQNGVVIMVKENGQWKISKVEFKN